MRTIVVSDRADDDLLAIFSYLQPRNPQAAEVLAGDIDQNLANLAKFPFSGSARPRLGAGIRCLIVAPYQIFYAVRPEQITVLRVLHGSRDVEAEFYR